MAENSNRISLWGIEVFLTTADEGALSAAARRLGASVSTISQQLTALETALGAQLIDRSTRPVGLTPAGRMFVTRARTILAEAEQARAELSVRDLSALKSLRLGVIEDFDATVTPQLLNALGQALTSCRFLLHTGASHRLLDQLEARALDIVVTTDPGTAIPGVETHPLVRDPFVVAAPKGLLDDRGDLLRQLQGHPFIHYTRRHHIGRQIADHLARQGLAPPHRFELDSYNAIMAMVAQGAGWTILTPLGILHAAQFQPQIDIRPLPLAPLARQISVHARTGEMREMPQQIAQQLRAILTEHVITPTVGALPWLVGDLALI
ncbi:LysR family transcriptional regulator [Actibacterium ureilyticum]|uniref:LysR family transcriptional regulator n=1 Tax=Actibacterium ureilyticum TaxID=1590614 RepID=UPI000BAABFFE|nr:LysR family transcriptional regulator [Actibacterium ureilyticum]